jgi:hypothetical protein
MPKGVYKRRQEVLEKMKTRKVTWGNKISQKLKGIKRSQETKDKLKGHLVSEISREKMRIKGKERMKNLENRMKGARFGKDSGNWKGGLSRITDKIRGIFEYRQWRSDVFTKDNFICQECQSNNCYLEAHHIIRLIDIVRKYNITTIEEAIQCSELWNINNGITLCQKCHKDKHK